MYYNCNVRLYVHCAVRGVPPAEGAATAINCAVNPELNSQQARYYANCKEASPSSVSRSAISFQRIQ